MILIAIVLTSIIYCLWRAYVGAYRELVLTIYTINDTDSKRWICLPNLLPIHTLID